MQPQTGTDSRDDQADAATLRRDLARARSRIAELERGIDREVRARAELMHVVSHELRTPITVISGFSRLLQNEVQGALNPDQHHFVAEVLKACRRLDQFVGDLLDAGPGGATPFAVVPAPGDLHETIEAQLESLAPLLEERGLKVEARLRCEAPGLVFDDRRIEQVISNLMTNAIRYGRASGVIRLATHSLEPKGGAFAAGGIQISVEDDGPGIPEADRERLFAPYVRGPQVGREGTGCSSEAASGLGIGLAISRRIVEAHGGRIWVEAGELGGARFVFELPRSSGAGGED